MIEKLKALWAKVPARYQASVKRFGKAIAAAALVAGANAVRTAIAGGEAISPVAVAQVVGVAVLLAAEKYLTFSP